MEKINKVFDLKSFFGGVLICVVLFIVLGAKRMPSRIPSIEEEIYNKVVDIEKAVKEIKLKSDTNKLLIGNNWEKLSEILIILNR